MLRRFVVGALILPTDVPLGSTPNEAKVPTAKDVLGAWDYAVADPQGRYKDTYGLG